MGHLNFLSAILLALSLVSVSGHPGNTLRAIKDLSGKDFGHNFPRHGLNLLYWFSGEYITFDNNNKMQPNRDPSQGYFGFHYYGNYDSLLPQLPWGYNYYVVGNLISGNQYLGLPNYVTRDYRNSQNSHDNNRDRIIVRRTPYGSIDQVYITQHYGFNSCCGSRYDPANTYAISADLIQAIRNTSRQEFLNLVRQGGQIVHYIHDELRKRRNAQEHKSSDGN